MWLLRLILDWAHGIERVPVGMDEAEYTLVRSKNIIWLYGLAGAGKSTVAHTVAKTLTMDGLYLAIQRSASSSPRNHFYDCEQ